MAGPAIKLRLANDRLILTGRVPRAVLDENDVPYEYYRDASGRPTYSIPWDTVHSRTLARYGLPGLSRMCVDYPFPANAIKPMEHQIQASDFLVRNHRAYLFLDMGLGKTLTALWALDYLRQIGVIKKALVVAPKSILYSAWYDEVCTHLPHMSATVITDDYAPRRKEKFKSQTFLHIINHDGPAWFYKELAANKYDVVVYDESTAIKNPTTKRFKGIRHLVKSTTILWEMTGTPTPQSPMDAYGQIRLMHNVDADAKRCPPSEIIGNAFMTERLWKYKTMESPGEGIWLPKDNANTIIHRYMQPAFCRTKGEVLKDLPPVIYMPPREAAPSKDQKAAERALKASNDAVGTNGMVVTAVNAAVRVSKIIQIGAGCAYAEDFEAGGDEGGKRLVATFDTSAKDAELMDIIEQAQGKVIVYCPFTAALHRLYDFLLTQKLNTLLIDGSVKPKEVRELVNKQFQSSSRTSPQVLVAMPQKLSHGITATAATETVWYSPVVRGEVYQQANNRMDRIGQLFQTNIHHLSGNSTERRLYGKLKDGTLSQRALLEIYQKFMET